MPALQRDRVRGRADRLAADLGHDDVGADLVEDPLEARKWRTVRSTHHASGCPRTADPCGRRRAARACRRSPRSAAPRPPRRRAHRAPRTTSAGSVREPALPQLPGRRSRDREVRHLVPTLLQLRAHAAVEIALVRLEGREEDAHRHPVSSGPANSRYTASWRCANSSQVKSAARSGPPAGGRSRAPRRSPARCSPQRWGRSTPRRCRRPRAAPPPARRPPGTRTPSPPAAVARTPRRGSGRRARRRSGRAPRAARRTPAPAT